MLIQKQKVRCFEDVETIVKEIMVIFENDMERVKESERGLKD